MVEAIAQWISYATTCEPSTFKGPRFAPQTPHPSGKYSFGQFIITNVSDAKKEHGFKGRRNAPSARKSAPVKERAGEREDEREDEGPMTSGEALPHVRL